MKRRMVLFALILGMIFFLRNPVAFSATYIAEPVLISQPAYFGNSFYMYRPSNLPAGALVQIDSQGGVVLENQQPAASFPAFSSGGEVKNAPVSLPQSALGSPPWLLNKNFMMVSAWKELVDRMGILYKPKLPIAWKGENPKVLFVWTGRSWWQIHCKDGETPQCALQRNIYALTKLSKEHQVSWTPQDAGFLSNQAALWGYYWMGYILPECK